MNFNVSKLAPYAKTVVALAGFVLLAANVCMDGTVTTDEFLQLATAAGVVLGVYHVPNSNK